MARTKRMTVRKWKPIHERSEVSMPIGQMDMIGSRRGSSNQLRHLVAGRRGASLAFGALMCLAACSPVPPPTPTDSPKAAPTAAPTVSISPVASTSAAFRRLGPHDLIAPSGEVVGVFSAERQTDEATQLTVSVRGDQAQPWGIFDQDACAPPAADHDAPFQFADIESGHQSDLVETPVYLGFPSNLVVLVFGPDGGSLAGCANLGPPEVALASPLPTDNCANLGQSSPSDGTLSDIAFSKDALSNSDIYMMDDRGSNVRRLTDALGVDMKPTWSPDGRQIAFRTSRDGQDEIYVMASDGSCERNLTANLRDDRSPAWSPDGCEIAYDHFFDARYQDIAAIPAAGGPARRITTRSGEYPSWSPDGKRIAFASARDGDYDIYIVNADGSGEHQVIDAAGYQMYPAWSPDGLWLAYESGSSTIDGLQIHVMRTDGTDDRTITHDKETNRFPAWSADGRLSWSASGTIVIADTLEAPPHAIGLGQFPAWRPTGISGASC